MFDMGFSELVVVGIVALLVLGPERLPVAARTAGLWIGKLKRMVQNVQHEINEELRMDELKKQAQSNKEHLAKFQQNLAQDVTHQESEASSQTSVTTQEQQDALNTLASESQGRHTAQEPVVVSDASEPSLTEKQHERT